VPDCTLESAGNAMAYALRKWEARYSRTRGDNKPARREERRKELNEELWTCQRGRPLRRFAAMPTVPTRPVLQGKTIFLEKGQKVVQAETLERLQAEAAAPLARRREADTLLSIAAERAGRAAKVQQLCAAAFESATAQHEEKDGQRKTSARAHEGGRGKREGAVVHRRRSQGVPARHAQVCNAMREAAAVQTELAAFKRRSAEEARRKVKELLPGLRETVAAAMKTAYGVTFARLSRLKLKACARARIGEREGRKSEGQLERAQAADAEAQELSAENEQLQEELEKLRRREASQPPDLGVVRVRGRFGTLPWQIRVLVWGELSRRTPPSAVGPNLVDAARVLAPGMRMRVPSLAEVRKMRCEMMLAGEACAAYQLASCVRRRCLGFDESTKLQKGVLSTSVQAEMPDGTTLDVVLQGALAIPGGTAEQVAHAPETRVFGRGRLALQGWADMHEKMWGAGSWSGPLAKALGLHRLGGGALVMSDTCNGARAAKRLVIQRIAAAVAADFGPEEWAKLSEAVQLTAACARAGDCMQHLRNIMLDAMSAAATAHLKEVLEDSPADFSSFERMSTDAMQLIHARGLPTRTPPLTSLGANPALTPAHGGRVVGGHATARCQIKRDFGNSDYPSALFTRG